MHRTDLIAVLLFVSFLACSVAPVSCYDLWDDDFAGNCGWSGGTATGGHYENTSSGYLNDGNIDVNLAKYVPIMDELRPITLQMHMNATFGSSQVPPNQDTWTVSLVWVDSSGSGTVLWSNVTYDGSYPALTSYTWNHNITFTPANQQGYLVARLFMNRNSGAGNYAYNLTIANVSLSVGSDPVGVYNITFMDEATLEPWGWFSPPWNVSLSLLNASGAVLSCNVMEDTVLYTFSQPQYIRAHCSNGLYSYYRQVLIDDDYANMTFYLAPAIADVGQVVFYVYDYVGEFPAGSAFTALKLVNGTYRVVSEGGIDVTRIVALYLTEGMTYYIRINGTDAEFMYGIFTPTVSPVTVQLTTSSLSVALNFTFTRSSATSVTAAYDDPSGLTSWVSIVISNSTHEIASHNSSVSTLLLATSLAPNSTWYSANFTYTLDGVNYTQVMYLGRGDADYLNSTVTPLFDTSLTVAGFPVLSLVVMGAMLTAGTVFTAYYARYGIACMAIMLVLFTYWGWIPDMRLSFAGIVGLMAVLYLLGIRGRA